ncbi:multidrug resistance-associated abc transporter [Colletotrichum camelliae]|nr:multidrug resistance-associated abc transporter [Colletotrichum camelliae]
MLNTTLSLGTSTMPPIDHYWEHYMMFPTVLATSDNTTAVALSSNTTKIFPVSTPARRMIPRLYSYPNGAVVDSVIVPTFEVNSFEWVKDIRNLPSNITKALRNASSNYLIISEDRSPLTQVIAGTSALLKESKWTRKPTDKLPDPIIYRGTKYAAIYVSRNWNQGKNENYTCPDTSPDFGIVPPGTELLNIPWNNNFSDCLAVAKLDITAGVTQCSQSDLSKSPESTCLWASNVLSTDNDTVSPDPLVNEIFAMMPEIQSLVVAISSYESGILQGHLEEFLRNSLVQAYQGGWSAMAEYLSPVETQRTTTSAWKPVVLLEATS